VLVYSGILGSVVLAMTVSLALRTPFKVDVVRDRGVLARIVEGGRIENVFRLQIMNATEVAQRFTVTAEGLPGLSVVPEGDYLIEPTQARWVAVRVQAPYDVAPAGAHTIQFQIAGQGSIGLVTEKSVFIVPR
jgi:polyferredoxin